MTSPVVGSVSVEVIASAKALAASLKKEVESAFNGLDLNKLVRNSIGNTKIKLPVEPDMDTDGIGEKVRRTRIPKVPVQLDPVLAAFQQEVRRQTAALAKTVNAKIPVDADTSNLRSELGAQLATIQAQTRIKVPTDPADKAAYEAKLRASIADAQAKVKASIPVDPDTAGFEEKVKAKSDEVGRRSKVTVKVDVDKNSFLGGIQKGFAGVANAIPNLPGLNLLSGGLQGIGSLVGTLGDLDSGISKAAGASAQLGGNLAGAAESATGPIGLVVGLLVAAGVAMGALGTAAVLAVPAISAVAGAAAAIPAALAGAGAVFGTLGLGFKGIAEAFKPKTGGGGGGGEDPAARARRVAGAERGVESARRGIAAASRALDSAERGLADAEDNVTQAQARAKLAQQAVSKARVEAAKDIDDLNRSLRGAKLSEEDAALSVTEALRALNEAKLTGNLPDIQRADLSYREAVQTLDEATATTKDLTTQQADQAKKGVEGSDKVQQALRDQQDALKGVKQAQEGVLDAQNAVLSANDGLKSSYDGLKSAQDSLADSQAKGAAGAAAAAAKLIPLAPAAQRFVDAIKALKPAFEGLRLEVQQRLFEGLDKTVTNLGNKWIPALKQTLGSFADTFNGFFKNLGASITTPKFIADLQAGAEGARRGMAAVGDSITTSLVPAFGALSKAAGPFLTQLGKEIANVVTEFSNWVLQGEKTGGLKDFFTEATKSLHDIFDIGGLVVGIVTDLISIIIEKPSTGGGQSALENFRDGLTRVKAYLDDPKNRQGIRDFFTSITDGLKALAGAASSINGFIDRAKAIKQTLFGAGDKGAASSSGSEIGQALVAGLLSGIVTGMGTVYKVIGGLLWDGAASLIGHIKSGLGIASPSTLMAEIGGQLIQGLMNGITGWLPNLSSIATRIRSTVTSAVGDPKGWLSAHGGNSVIGFANGLIGRLPNLGAIAGNIRVTVQNTLSSAGSWLINHGRAVINGLINGISSALGSLGSFLGSVGTFIQAHKGPIEKDRLLLVGAGQAIMGGLISGISDKKSALAAELSDVSSLVAGTAMPALSADLGSMTGSLSKSATLEARWADGMTGDPFLDAIRRSVKFGYQGSVQAALGSG